jgi:hypothetical protein
MIEGSGQPPVASGQFATHPRTTTDNQSLIRLKAVASRQFFDGF